MPMNLCAFLFTGLLMPIPAWGDFHSNDTIPTDTLQNIQLQEVVKVGKRINKLHNPQMGMTFLHPIASFLEYPDHADYVGMMILVVALDSFQCVPFSYLRYKKRPIKFAAIKMLNIVGNIGLNLFFLLLCPWLYVHAPETVSWFYHPDYQVGYIFVSNLIMSVI